MASSLDAASTTNSCFLALNPGLGKRQGDCSLCSGSRHLRILHPKGQTKGRFQPWPCCALSKRLECCVPTQRRREMETSDVLLARPPCPPTFPPVQKGSSCSCCPVPQAPQASDTPPGGLDPAHFWHLCCDTGTGIYRGQRDRAEGKVQALLEADSGSSFGTTEGSLSTTTSDP